MDHMTLHAVTRAIIVTWVTAFFKDPDHNLFCQVTIPGHYCVWVTTPGTVEGGKTCESCI